MGANALTAEERKLAELVLYISVKCMTHNKFGAVKLNKILFFSDFMFFKHHGKPITGVEYFKLENGPAPKCLLRVRASLQSESALVIALRTTAGGVVQHRTIAMRAPNLSEFSAEEISVVDEVIELLRDKSADQVSALSHYYVVGWNLYGLKDTIPYESVFARMMKEEYVTEKDIRRAKEVARKHGLTISTEIQGS